MRLNVIFICISIVIGVGWGTTDLTKTLACSLINKTFTTLVPEFDQEIQIRNSDERDVRSLLEKRGYLWTPIIGQNTHEILKKWNAPLSIERSDGMPGFGGDWGNPIETWQYDGYYLLFNQHRRCFYVCQDGVWH